MKTMSVSGWAEALQRDRGTLARHIRRAGVQPVGKDGKANLYRIQDLVTATPVHLLGIVPADDLDPVQEGARLKKMQADKCALEVGALEKRLLPAEVVESTWQHMVTNFRARMLTLPSKLAAECAGLDHREATALATTLVHDALEELSDYNPDDYDGGKGENA